MTDSSPKNSPDFPVGAWLPYDLAGNFCEECGRPKINRLFFGEMTCGDCATCIEVITRHRCTKRPHEADRAPGQEWECPECESIWGLKEEDEPCPDCCPDCGHTVAVRRWVLLEEGPDMENAPRYKIPVYTPMRNLFRDGSAKRDKPFQGLPPV